MPVQVDGIATGGIGAGRMPETRHCRAGWTHTDPTPTESLLNTPTLAPYICRYGVMWLSEDPESRHRLVLGTVVFTDLSGFTALSERLATLGRVGSEEMATQLDRVFTALLAEARDRGGSLVHFGGDALVLLFSGPDHEIRGTCAAGAMATALRTHGRMRTPAGTVRLGMSTGVWSGDVDLFLLGKSSRQLLIGGPAARGDGQQRSDPAGRGHRPGPASVVRRRDRTHGRAAAAQAPRAGLGPVRRAR
jgi:hypothetical protein